MGLGLFFYTWAAQNSFGQSSFGQTRPTSSTSMSLIQLSDLDISELAQGAFDRWSKVIDPIFDEKDRSKAPKKS